MVKLHFVQNKTEVKESNLIYDKIIAISVSKQNFLERVHWLI